MPYRLKRKESVADGILRIANEQFVSAEGELGASHRPEIVHRARKRLKMLRALLRLVRPALARAEFDRENMSLRDIGRTLSRLRDADVLVDVIRGLQPERSSDAVFKKVVARARLDRLKIQREYRGAATITEARKGIQAAHERLDQWSFGPIDPDTIVEGLRRSVERAQDAAAAVRRSRDDERWHEWRKRTKDLWYHLRLVRAVWPPVMEGAIGQFKALADDLGDDHDLVVITGRLPELMPPRGAARESRRIRQTIDRRRRELQERAREQGSRLLAGSPRAFAKRFEACWESWRS